MSSSWVENQKSFSVRFATVLRIASSRLWEWNTMSTRKRFSRNICSKLAADGELEIQLDLSLPHRRTFGPEVHFQKHRMDHPALHDLEVGVRHEWTCRGEWLAEVHPPLARESHRQRMESCSNEYGVHGLLVSEKLTARDECVLFPRDETLCGVPDQGCTLRRKSIERLLSAACGSHKPSLQESRPDELQQPAVGPPYRAEAANGFHLVAIEHPREDKRPQKEQVARSDDSAQIPYGRHSRSSSAPRRNFFWRSAMSRSM